MKRGRDDDAADAGATYRGPYAPVADSENEGDHSSDGEAQAEKGSIKGKGRGGVEREEKNIDV
jgi:hypothetical protein